MYVLAILLDVLTINVGIFGTKIEKRKRKKRLNNGGEIYVYWYYKLGTDMKFGFRIVYHKSIQKNDELIKFLTDQVNLFNTEDSYKTGYKPSPYRRRGQGIPFVSKDGIECRFKRLSTNRRIFGVIPVSELDGPVKTDGCLCQKCVGSVRVGMNKPYTEEDYITYTEIGEIKG